MDKEEKSVMRLKNVTISIFLVLFISVVLLSGCSNNAKQSSQESNNEGQKIVLKLGTNTAPSHPENKAAAKFAEIVKEKTNGQVEIQVFDSAKLGDHKERLEGLRMGTVDMTTTSVGYMATYEKVMTIFEMPYLFKDKAHEFRVYDGEVGKDIDNLLQKHGFRVLAFFDMGARQLTNNVRPVAKPEDIKGLKIRVPDTESSIDGLRAMGASPTPMAFSELYMALQQKTVDGQENPFSIIDSSKFYEVQKYLSLTNHQLFAQLLLIGEKSWEKLSPEHQKIIMNAAKEAEKYEREIMQNDENNLLSTLKQKGMKVNEVDIKAFQEMVKPLREQYIQKYGQQAKDFFDKIDKVQ